MTTTSEAKTGGGARVRVQRFGTFLSGMVMPNIPAFIAWGLITSLFIATGWLPNGILSLSLRRATADEEVDVPQTGPGAEKEAAE